MITITTNHGHHYQLNVTTNTGNTKIELMAGGLLVQAWPCDTHISNTGSGFVLAIGSAQVGPLSADQCGNIATFLDTQLAAVGIDWHTSAA